MSRSGDAGVPASPLGARHASILALWHLACTAGVGGCFYVKPIPDLIVNEPPNILFPTQVPQPVRVLDGTVRMTIRASDPEGGPLYFEWPDLDNVPHDPPERFSNGPIEVSSVRVLRPDLLPERVVAFVVDDDEFNVVPVEFRVVFP